MYFHVTMTNYFLFFILEAYLLQMYVIVLILYILLIIKNNIDVIQILVNLFIFSCASCLLCAGGVLWSQSTRAVVSMGLGLQRFMYNFPKLC